LKPSPAGIYEREIIAMSLASAEQPVTRSSEFGTLNYVFLSVLWFAFFAQWATVIPTIVPDQVRVILGPTGTNYGAYIAADWALALCVLPNGTAAGKDMGIWHVSLVLPQIVGSAAIGWMITALSPWITTRFAYASAFALCGLLLVAASILIKRIRCPNDATDGTAIPGAMSRAG
jgi:hypothetical protein